MFFSCCGCMGYDHDKSNKKMVRKKSRDSIAPLRSSTIIEDADNENKKLDIFEPYNLISDDISKKKKSKNSKKLCMTCKNSEIKYIREFDYKKLPPEYFHRPDNSVITLANQFKASSKMFPDFWIQLPKDLVLTKYVLCLCSTCYDKISSDPIQPWNRWTKV